MFQRKNDQINMIYAIHAKVQGRVRYKVQGLYRSEALKTFFESRLPKEKEIFHVSPRTSTGNLLIHFNPDISHDYVTALIKDLLEENSLYKRSQQTKSSTNSHHQKLLPVHPSNFVKSELGLKIKEQVAQF